AEPGHNPLGALSVLALLVLLLTQISLGLFAVDVDGIESGPLSHLVSFDVGRQCAEIHEWIFNALMVFTALHVAAILYYLLLRRDNLIGPMITGFKTWSSASSLKFASWWRVLPGAAISAAIVWYIVK
ncbi:MAG TPA: cytochrome b/b6 domain-containing protein, partial [Steroidobacteraceae bacterium]|nr:cytochrome b/b6 domain-containing protein [Steroidobacteraceae bacterium]